jgi:hypothetical protein
MKIKGTHVEKNFTPFSLSLFFPLWDLEGGPGEYAGNPRLLKLRQKCTLLADDPGERLPSSRTKEPRERGFCGAKKKKWLFQLFVGTHLFFFFAPPPHPLSSIVRIRVLVILWFVLCCLCAHLWHVFPSPPFPLPSPQKNLCIFSFFFPPSLSSQPSETVVGEGGRRV